MGEPGVINDQDAEIEIFTEQNLQPLSPSELLSEIESQKTLLEVYQNNIAALTTAFEEASSHD